MIKFGKVFIIMVCTLLFSGTSYAIDTGRTATFLEFEAGQNTGYLDGEPFSLDVAPIVDNKRIFVPVYYVTDAFGYTLSKGQADQQFKISKGLLTIIFSIGSKQVLAKDQDTNTTITLEVPPKCIGEHILVPVQFFRMCMNCQVYQGNTEQKVLIASVGPGGQRIGADVMMSYLEETGKDGAWITVAVIDTGVDISHPYLQNRIVQAYNVAKENDDVQDMRGHGTMVAGIIANCTPETVKIMPIKAEQNQEDIAKAIEYAVKNGASVINISLSASVERDNCVVTEAVAEAVRQGCSVVVAAGNYGKDVKYYTPANADNAIVVTALNRNDVLDIQSNFGETVVVSAPGTEIVSTMPNNDYGSKSGTSFAAPYAASAAAMIQMDIPGITPVEIRQLLLDYSRDLGTPGKDNQYGGGCVDLERYVLYRRNGLIKNSTKAIEKRNSELDAQIEEFRKEKADEHLKMYGLFFRQLFASELGGKAMELYNTGDFYAAGYHLEKAVSFAENASNQSNLAYMLRRGEYVSSTYSIQRLLEKAEAAGDPSAFINDALLKAAYGDWEAADQVMSTLCQRKIDFNGILDVPLPWKKMSYHDDAEGDLVLGWLVRYGVYSDERFTQQELMERALVKYPTLPSWLTLSTPVK